jgi:hypothetical protein
MPGFTQPTIPNLIAQPGMYRGRDGTMKVTPTFPNRDRNQQWGRGKGTFGGMTPTFGQGRPPIDAGFNRTAGNAPGMKSPWDDNPDDAWSDSIGDVDIDPGMGRMIDRRPPDRDWWEDRMADIRGQMNTVDPSTDWGDDRWMDTYEPGDYVQVKADGNPNFGKAWDGDSWEDTDPNDPSNASMFAESAAWDDDYQTGLKEAWANNDETAFQRWRNLARANMQSQWQDQAQTSQPAQPVYSLPKQPGKPTPKQPTTPQVPPYREPDPWPKKQTPIY